MNIFNYISLFKIIFSENNLSNEIKREDKGDNINSDNSDEDSSDSNKSNNGIQDYEKSMKKNI